MKYHHIGDIVSDPCPGLSQSWSIYLGKDKKGIFHIQYEDGTGFDIGNAESAREWINCSSGLDSRWDVADLLEVKIGFAKLVKQLRS